VHRSRTPTGDPAAAHPRPWRSPLARDDAGSASVEFLGAGVILLVPLVYLVLALSAVQSAAFAVEGAARDAARSYVQSATAADGERAVDDAVTVALADGGVSADPRVELTCAPAPADCLTRRGLVSVSVTVDVPLPLLPPLVAGAAPPALEVGAASTQQVSRFADLEGPG
jgi:Flp pilus assembly protein TadG